MGAGLFGSVIAHEMAARGKRVLVIDKRDHIGGNCYTNKVSDINVHLYGAHIFRTSDNNIWEYMSQFCEFNHFINSPVANYKGQLYNLPFNMNTFHQLWRVVTPKEAKQKLTEDCIPCDKPQNLEEHVLSIAGHDIYEKLVKGYTEKQWGRKCIELPPSIMRRIPLRFRFDNNYFNDTFQGIPKGGYTPIFEKLLQGAEVRLNCDFSSFKKEMMKNCKKVVYTGAIDEFYDNKFGELEYRSLEFEHTELDEENHQGVAVVNYTDSETPFTRKIEHKHFEFGQQPTTIVTKEYPVACTKGVEPYYPMEDEVNQKRYNKYAELASREENVYFGGRLGEYRYYDMQDTIISALELVKRIR